MATKKSVRKNKEPKASRPHMPGYGLPKGTKGLLPWSWAEQRLKKSHNYWIATSKPAMEFRKISVAFQLESRIRA